MKTIERIISVIEILDTGGWTIMFDRNAILVKNEYHSLTFDNYPGIRLAEIEKECWYKLEADTTGTVTVGFDDEVVYMTC